MKQRDYALNLFDIHDDFMPMVKEFIPLLLTATLLCLGEAGYGKTPFMMIIAFAMARWRAEMADMIGEVAIRISSGMFFFRGEAGLRWIRCIFDDGDLWDQRPKILKLFSARQWLNL